ncbi:5'-nucleotidase SurE isoform X2 [Brassica rapa]|uniref:5'-nucleotidase SurE isoform X1 n=1 Tax=Brassica campestris TaxID=3711 RepID=UPI00142E7D0E|nr:5'-nucleotidase SurE isoform X1 [Brassica rapa]XP_018512442.2 5'-nucleotidase SurE isoform X2 [Brassica rapa]
MTSKNNGLSAALVSNLQDVLSKRKGGSDGSAEEEEPPPSTSVSVDVAAKEEIDDSRPIVLVTNGDGIDSIGLVSLVEALVSEGLYNVHVCAPQTDKSVSSHSMTPGETIAASSADIKGATAFEVSGTTVDCISLGLSGALFAWSKPILVISGINQGSSCGHQMFYSGAVAGAREALISGVPSLSISLNWKKDESKESDFKDAVGVSLPLINATIRDIEKGVFPKDCSLNIEIPTSPSSNKGFKVTKQSMWRQSPSWQAVSANRHPGAGNFMSNQQSLGAQLAQLGRDASAAGAARRFTTQKKSIVEIESVGVAAKTDSRVKKYFRLEFVGKEQEHTDEDLDIKALEDGFVSVTPLSLLPKMDPETQAAASEWISKALNADQ